MPWLQKDKGKIMKILLKSIFIIFIISCFPIIFLYANNPKEISFYELTITALCFYCVGLIIWCILRILTKNSNKALVLAAMAIIVFSNYHHMELGIRKVFGFMEYWHLVPIICFLLFVFYKFVKHNMKDSTANAVVLVLAISFSALFAVNVVLCLPYAYQSLKEQEVDNSFSVIIDEATPKRNIYYFVFDEYSNFPIIKKYYDYDNSGFETYLKDYGFSISYDSHNECYSTTTILTNILNLNYVSTPETAEDTKLKMREQAKIYDIFKQAGYEIIGVGKTANSMGVESKSQNNSKGGGQTAKGESFFQILVRNTVFYPFVKMDNDQRAKDILNGINYFKDKDNYKNKTSVLTVSYFESPHEPFLFDNNGNAVSPQHYYDWDEKKYYLDQYKFITDCMKTIVANIIENDPDSIIFLSSDHSARFREEFEEEDKRNPFHAVYAGKDRKLNIAGKSGVNTMRTIIGEALDLDMGEVEVPTYD